MTPALHCSVEDQRRLLGASPYFASLSAKAIDSVQRQFDQHHYAEGEVIHLAGAPANRLSVVAAGSVKQLRSTWDGKDVVLDLLAPGDHFGSLAELGDQEYRDTAIAHTECCILSTTSKAFAQMLVEYPAVARDALALVSARLRSAQSTIEQLSAHTAEERLASALVRLAQRIGKPRDGAVLIDIPLSRQDLADMTGTTVETASRVMSQFRREGLIQSGRRWTSVLDLDALTERAN